MTCHAGRVHALIGENGAGKSTLLGILAGSRQPDGGSIRIDGVEIDLEAHTPQSARKLGVAVVYQELALVPSMSVVDNMFLGREVTDGISLDRRGMRQLAREVLHRLGARIHLDTPAEQLSIAQGQLVEIARALLADMRVLALDEPSASLAGPELEGLFSVVRALRQQGVAILYVSHRLSEIAELCDDYTVLRDGQVTGSGQVSQTDEEQMIRLMIGRDMAQTFPPRQEAPSPRPEPLLRVRGATVDPLIEDISFDAFPGEILGVAGLIGSGRTTLGKALFGSIRLNTGQVECAGRLGPFRSTSAALQAGLAYLPEDRKGEGLALEKSVRTNLTLLRLPQLRGKLSLVQRRQEAATVQAMVERLSIRTDPSGEQIVGLLSGGNQQKVVLGKWLLAGPRVLILDEPTRGIDIGAKGQIYELLRSLAEEGHSVIVMSSELMEIIGLCDRTLVLCEGQLAGELFADELTEESIMQLATPSTSAVPA